MNISNENLIELLCGFAVNLKFGDLQREAIHEAKRRIIDALACLIAGSDDPACVLTRGGSEGKNTAYYNAFAFGMPKTYTLEDAAFLNSHSIRVLDWNDTYLSKEPAHPSDNIGALLAMLGNKNCDGENFITAMVLAYEIQCRFCDAASLRKRGWDHTYYLQLSSAIACGKILGLSKEEMIHAASRSLVRVPLRQGRAGSKLSHEKALYAAEASRIGISAAIMAQNGTTGSSEIIEGEFGVLKQIVGELDLSAFNNLGKNFKILKTHIKPYPVEYHAQAAVEAALRIRKIIDAKNIEGIDITTYEFAKSVIGDKAKRRPETKESADHSLYFVLASTLLDGEMSLQSYRPERLQSAQICELIDKMSDIAILDEYEKAYYDKLLPEFPISLKVLTKDGWWIKEDVRIPKGHFADPLSDDDIASKLKNLSQKKLSGDSQKKLLDICWGLENFDANGLYRAFEALKWSET
ncbi:MAG: MmgE/PrpD family protein [bacterium]|nr:MmgE/PrpD family protein [bacterium]